MTPLNNPGAAKGGEAAAADRADAVLRLASIALRRFTRDPDTRASSSLNLLRYAIRLHADQTSPGAAALAAGEIVGELAQQARLEEREGGRRGRREGGARKAKGGA